MTTACPTLLMIYAHLIMLDTKTLYLARHAETVFNRAARMQGNSAHTPLTSNGMRQALAMADHLRDVLGPRPDIQFWCSPAGRTRQTAAAIADALELDYFSITFDERLREIDVGAWEGRTYAQIVAEQGEILDPEHRVFTQKPPKGEWYDDIQIRLKSWAKDVADHPSSVHLAISHGLASRVLRGMLSQRDWHEPLGAHIAPDITQGHLVCLRAGSEEILKAQGPQSQLHAKGV